MQKVALIGIVVAAVVLLAIFATQQKTPVESTATPAKAATEMATAPAAPVATPTMSAAEAIADADAAIKRAASVGGEWRDTGAMLKKAQEAADAGDEAKALKLAKQAKAQGDLGYTQATTQPDPTTPPYLNN